MSFARPELLFLCLLAVPELTLAAARSPRLRLSLSALAGPRKRKAAVSLFAALSSVGTAAGALFILSAALSLAGPSWGRRGSVTERSGLEAAIVMDVSRSMETAESGGTRLESAKELVRSVLSLEASSPRRASFSIVAAKGEAVLLSPMTEDLAALESALDYLGPDAVTTAGTDLERGLAAGIASFTSSHPGDRLILLLSDGGELSGSLRRAAGEAARSRCRLLVVGVGASEPRPVPGADGSPQLDSSGARIYSSLERGSLSAAAEAGGGRYLELSDPGTRKAIIDEIASAAAGGTRIEYASADRSGDFALAALVFLAIAILADAIISAAARRNA